MGTQKLKETASHLIPQGSALLLVKKKGQQGCPLQENSRDLFGLPTL